MPTKAFCFGSFKLISNQQLFRDDVPIRLGSRALAILSILVEHAGELVSKQDLMSKVWPDTFVDESNLKVNIAAVRRALDMDNDKPSHINNVSGRGYQFAPAVNVSESNPDTSLEHRRRAGNLPRSLKQIVGRSEAIQQVVIQLSQCGLLTVCGAPGVGKTTVAIAAAEALLPIYKDGVFFVDFSSLNDPNAVPRALCAALCLPITTQNAFEQLISDLEHREILLVIDNCEHLLCAAAECLELIRACCPKVHILATSRELLGVKGERLYRLPPLDVPPSTPDTTPDSIRAYPAVTLFLQLAAETWNDFRVDDSEVLRIAELCRELEGIPLAIELAAVRVRLLGLEGLPSVESEHFLQTRHWQRTAPRRHESLAATYEWSFDLLSDDDRWVLFRLSTLNSSFDLETALSVASGPVIGRAETSASIASLVSKSMVERLGHGASNFRISTLIRYCASKRLLSRNSCIENQAELLQLAS